MATKHSSLATMATGSMAISTLLVCTEYGKETYPNANVSKENKLI